MNQNNYLTPAVYRCSWIDDPGKHAFTEDCCCPNNNVCWWCGQPKEKHPQ